MKGFSLWTSFILENKQGLVEPITFVFSLIEVFFLIKNINPRKKSTPGTDKNQSFSVTSTQHCPLIISCIQWAGFEWECNLRISFFLCHLQNYISLHTLVTNNRATIRCLYSEFLIQWTDSNCLVSSAALVSLAYLYINQLFTWLNFWLKWSSSVKVDLQMTQTKATVSSCSPWVWSWSLFNCSMKNSLQSLFG